MKRLKNTLIFGIILYYLIPLSVMAVTPEEVAAVGKEQSAAGVFIWFLCAIAFLKVSQKIDSFMASLGVNVGRTGGSMMAELMIAARGITSVKSLHGGSFFRGGSIQGGSVQNQASFLSGGLVGAVGRHITQSAVNTMTGHTSNPISRKIYESSLNKGGAFANNITAAIAQGSMNMTGSMQGEQLSPPTWVMSEKRMHQAFPALRLAVDASWVRKPPLRIQTVTALECIVPSNI